MTDLDDDTRLKLIGLQTIARDLNKQLEAVVGAVVRLVGDEEGRDGWASDFCYSPDNVTPETLWEGTAKYREKDAA